MLTPAQAGLKQQLVRVEDLLRTGIGIARRVGNTSHAQEGMKDVAINTAGGKADTTTRTRMKKKASLDLGELKNYVEARYAE